MPVAVSLTWVHSGSRRISLVIRRSPTQPERWTHRQAQAASGIPPSRPQPANPKLRTTVGAKRIAMNRPRAYTVPGAVA